MPLNKLENFIKNTEGRILYVNPNDLDATDAITNQGNSLTKPFKTVQRALLESARFSYLRGNDNDLTEKTTILLFPGEYIIDNRPGYAIKEVSNQARAVAPTGEETAAVDTLSLTLESNFDITQEDNILYKFNSIYGGVVVPRGTSIVGLDLRKTKVRAKYVPNPTDSAVGKTAIFRITGACYFWQLSFFDADETGVVYTDDIDFSTNNQSKPTFSHHKLTCFEYADGVNIPSGYQISDLNMYYSKLSNAFNLESGRDIDQKYPDNPIGDAPLGFSARRPEYEIVGAFANDPIVISSIKSGDGFVPTVIVTVTTTTEHNLNAGTPIKIRGVAVEDYNISTKVQTVISETEFTYLLSAFRDNLPASPSSSSTQTVTVETDTVTGASPYVFNCSLRSVWGMNGMHSDGNKATGFKSMVVAQFTGVSLQKDDRSFVKYDPTSRVYDGITITKQTGTDLSKNSSALNASKVYHLDSNAIYRKGWETSHIKISNDAFIQVVSVFAIGFNRHFDVQSGGDASITNSNSNFGQISLVAEGFKKNAFEKDNNAYVTSIVAPKAVTRSETDIDWISLDVQKTINVGISSHLYLYGLTAKDDPPPVIIQGYRIGAKRDEKLYLNSTGATIKTASICMVDSFVGAFGNIARGSVISEKEYTVSSGPTTNILTLSVGHGLQNGEKIRIVSETGDLPENIEPHIVYYAITSGLGANQIKIAASKTNADAGIAINIYGGTSIKILSRVSDKTSGELGSPVQYDSVNSQWYIHSTTANDIYTELVAQGVGVLGERTNVTYIKRIEDPRSLEDKLYKLRVVVPQNSINAKDPTNSFIIQESSSTGIGSDGYASNTTITASDYNYNKNLKIINKCSIVGTALSVISETPHNLRVNDVIVVKNVTSDQNPSGQDNLGYNGTFRVTEIVSDKVFKYGSGYEDVFGIVHVPGTFTGITTIRTTNLPRFERNDVQNNYYIYRNDTLTPYIFGVQDGVYQIAALNFENAIPTEFTDFKYSQNIVDLYPQLDKDNLVENPRAASTFAKRSPLGDVITNELQRSITRETIDSFVPTFGAGVKITGVSTTFTSTTLGTATLTFEREHGFNGIATYSSLTGGSGKTNGTYYAVKLFNDVGLTDWRGATAKVVVSGNQVTSAEIMSGGSGYSGSFTLYFDTGVVGGSVNASVSVTNSGISSCVGNAIQVTGLGNTSDGYYKIVSIPSKTQVAFAITNFDPKPLPNQYVLNTGPSANVLSTVYNSSVGIATIATSLPHGLLAGNRFRVTDSTGSNLGDFLVKEKVSNTSFSAITNNSLSSAAFILKHAFSSNDAVSDRTDENISIRNVHFYDNQILRLDEDITNDTSFQVSLLNSQVNVMSRFPLGSYILVDSEIMRVSRNGLTGGSGNELNVIRGVLGTRTQDHTSGSLIRKIKVLPIEFRRPSISRASGHTFEYLGYGPGNYSTGLPQLQVKTITEREDYLSQAQERSGGTVVYTGMNSDGDFFIGNTKYSASSGTQKTFDIPVPTVTAEDPSRTSVIFDEVRVKERLLVEGGNSSTVLSQFDGPVTFNNEIKFNDTLSVNALLKVVNQEQSINKDTGSIVTEGGIGVEKNLNVGGNAIVTGNMTVNGNASINGEFTVGSSPQAFTVNNNLNVTGVATVTALNISTSGMVDGDLGSDGGSDGIFGIFNTTNSGTTVFFNKDSGGTYNDILTLANASATVDGILTVNGDLRVTGDIIAFYTSDQRLKDNIKPIDDPLAKVLSISGNTYSWNEQSGKEGTDVGVIAQEILEVLPEAVTTRENGYLAVHYEKLVPLLVEAIKELSQKVESLENKLNNK
jgi:hypothetical protein